MENNQGQNSVANTQTSTQPANSKVDTPQVVAAPPQPEIIEVSGNKGGPGSKAILIILAIAFLIILAGGAYYYYQMRQSAVGSISSPTPTPTATPDPLVQETEGVTLEDVNGEFVEIDKDLKEL